MASPTRRPPRRRLLPIRRSYLQGHPAPVGTGSVLIDIDATVGAVIVEANRNLAGRECFLRGPDARERHLWLLSRQTPSGTAVAAVFSDLEPGSYELWVENDSNRHHVLVRAGEIVEIRWSQPGEDETGGDP